MSLAQTAAADISVRGYWVLSADGDVWPYGAASFHGEVGTAPSRPESVDIAAAPDGRGYWVLTADGAVHAFGTAPQLGDVPPASRHSKAVGITADPHGCGYWVLTADGQVHAFGSAVPHGGVDGTEVVCLRADPAANGYLILARDGVVHCRGATRYFGDARHPGAVAVDLAACRDGYWVLGADGRVSAFGDAVPFGDLTEDGSGASVRRIASTSEGCGYLLLGPSGLVYPFGVATLHEDPSAHHGVEAVALALLPGVSTDPLPTRAAEDPPVTVATGWLDAPDPSDPLVTVVIPVHGRAALTERCLRSVVEHGAAVDYEIVVVDDASPDDTATLLARAHGVHTVALRENQGFVRACNAGAEAARGEYLVFLNNDTEVRAGWLDALVDTAVRSPDIGLVGATILQPDGLVQEVGGIIWNDGTAQHYGRGESPTLHQFRHVRDTDYCSGCCLLIPRALFTEIGGFDETLGTAYYDDVDLAFGVRARGLRVVVCPGAVVEHAEGSSYGGDENPAKTRLVAVAKQRFAAKWRVELEAQWDRESATVAAARQRSARGHIVMVDSEVPTWDQDAGSLRAYRLIRILLGLGFSLTFFTENGTLTEPYSSELRELGVELVGGVSPDQFVGWLQDLGPALRGVILSRPDPAWRHLGPLRRALPGVPVIYDIVDLHFLREERRAGLEADEGLAAFAKVVQGQELAIARSCDVVVTATEHERDVFSVLAPEVVSRSIPTIHEVQWNPPGPEGRHGLLFVGGFRHPPNADAVRWMVHDVLPELRSLGHEPVLNVVGSNVPPEIASLASAQVIVHGWVPDLGDIHDQSRVFVAPLRFGAGMKGKIGESLARGLPVVATSIGAEGITSNADVDGVVIADDAAAFAAAIARLLEDDRAFTTLSASGQRCVDQNFSVRVVTERVVDVLELAGIDMSAEWRTVSVPAPR
jgi:GT2 family glycosyltransferase/glycosyltransferase involved in cell wall biosynthesis